MSAAARALLAAIVIGILFIAAGSYDPELLMMVGRL